MRTAWLAQRQRSPCSSSDAHRRISLGSEILSGITRSDLVAELSAEPLLSEVLVIAPFPMPPPFHGAKLSFLGNQWLPPTSGQTLLTWPCLCFIWRRLKIPKS